MVTQMRVLLAVQRMRAVASSTARITTRDVLGFATVDGARAIGLGGVTGSLTPGKQADLLVVEAEAINTMPLNDAPTAGPTLPEGAARLADHCGRKR